MAKHYQSKLGPVTGTVSVRPEDFTLGVKPEQLRPLASRAHAVMNKYSQIFKILPAGGKNVGESWDGGTGPLHQRGSHCRILPGDCIIAVIDKEDRRRPTNFLHLTNTFREGQITFLDGTMRSAYYRGELDFEKFALLPADGREACTRYTSGGYPKVQSQYRNKLWAFKLATFRQTRPDITSFRGTIQLKNDIEQVLGTKFEYAIGYSSARTNCTTRFNRALQDDKSDWKIIPFAFVKTFLGIAAGLVTGGPAGAVLGGISTMVATLKTSWAGGTVSISESDRRLAGELVSTFRPAEAEALFKQANGTLGRMSDFIGDTRRRAMQIEVPGLGNPYEKMIASTGLNMDVDLNDYAISIGSGENKKPFELKSVTLYT